MRFLHEWRHGGKQKFWARAYIKSEHLQSALAIAFPFILVGSLIGYCILAHAVHVWYTASFWLLLCVVWSLAPTVFIIYLFLLRLRERQQKEEVFDLDEDLRGDYDTGKLVEDEYDEVDERVLVRGGINTDDSDGDDDDENANGSPRRILHKNKKDPKRFTLDFIAEGYVEHTFVPTVWNGLGITGCVFGILSSILASISSFIVGDVSGGFSALITLFTVVSCMYLIIHRSFDQKQSKDIEMSSYEVERARTMRSIVVAWKCVGVFFGLLVVGITILASLQAFVYAFNEGHYHPPGAMIDIGGGRHMHLHCESNELTGPTVIFLHGWGGQAYDWSWIQPNVSEYAKTCTLDRAGYGWSDPPDCLLCPRDAKSKAQDLDALFKAAKIDQESLVLVLDAEAIFEARVFVNTYPDYNICGIVCIDCMDTSSVGKVGLNKKNPAPPFWDVWRNLLPSGIPGVLAAAGKLPKFQSINLLPSEIQPVYIQNQLKPKYPQSVVRDYIALPQAAQQAIDAGDFGSIKMTAIIAGKSYNATNVTDLSTNSAKLYFAKAPRDVAYHKSFSQYIIPPIRNMVVFAKYSKCAART